MQPWDAHELGVLESAFLAGGPRRVVDTVLVAMVWEGRLRASRNGTLSAVIYAPRNPVEAAVHAALGPGNLRQVAAVRAEVMRHPAVQGIGDRLAALGLLHRREDSWWARLLGRRGPWEFRLTPAGRRALANQRTRIAPHVAAAAGLGAVALYGLAYLPDEELRTSLEQARHQAAAAGSGGGGYSSPLWCDSASCGSGSDGGGSGGDGGSGCGSSCGGGCGGGGG
ncbi:hypothetical protein C3Y87_04540 [Carbonactinospora thermoautotrophica]|uniref:TIGR04222 domain-containing membrane protein n=1 Tax=Carbonactinospora thermoautotrophica TaxID=1469144 RepID=UPI0022707B19|nr:TIGR04222 domain-containing membrane protein [Carbonactinospora thermoautotrophica]MCX9190691.1 hypothetical protein [Carbonactinospora thermoautotrophica]